MSRLRDIGTLGCIIALVSTGCAGPQHRTVLPWAERADKHVHGPNDLFMPQPEPTSGLSRYFPRLTRAAETRTQLATRPRDRQPIGQPKGPARLDEPEPMRPDDGSAGNLDLQARLNPDAESLPVTMLAPVDPRSVAEAELDANADGVIDRRPPPFRAKDDRAARLVQARGGDLQGSPDPFGNLDRFQPPAAVSWPEATSETTPAEAPSNPSETGIPSRAERPGAIETASAFVPVESQEPAIEPTENGSDPFEDLRLPPIPADTAGAEPTSGETLLALPVPESMPEPDSPVLAETEAGEGPARLASVAPREEAGAPETRSESPVPPVRNASETEATFTQDVGSASDPFAGLHLPAPPMDANLFEPVPAGRPRLDPSTLGVSSMYAPSVRRMVASDEEYQSPGLAGRPRVPMGPDETSLPEVTFPPTYYGTGAPRTPQGADLTQPLEPSMTAPAPRRHWSPMSRLIGRIRDRHARAEQQQREEASAYDPPYGPVQE